MSRLPDPRTTCQNTDRVAQGANRYILHKQKAVSNSAGGVIDSLKRRRALHPSHKKRRDELGSGTEYTVEAMLALQEYATECLAVFDGTHDQNEDRLRNTYTDRNVDSILLLDSQRHPTIAVENTRNGQPPGALPVSVLHGIFARST